MMVELIESEAATFMSMAILFVALCLLFKCLGD
jgi:hypothetical protein